MQVLRTRPLLSTASRSLYMNAQRLAVTSATLPQHLPQEKQAAEAAANKNKPKAAPQPKQIAASLPQRPPTAAEEEDSGGEGALCSSLR